MPESHRIEMDCVLRSNARKPNKTFFYIASARSQIHYDGATECLQVDGVLQSVAEETRNSAVIYVVGIDNVNDFSHKCMSFTIRVQPCFSLETSI